MKQLFFLKQIEEYILITVTIKMTGKRLVRLWLWVNDNKGTDYSSNYIRYTVKCQQAFAFSYGTFQSY